jgi:hypothetical protein
VPLRGLHWVHVDAHPDLLLPRGLSPEAALDPDLLYQALEYKHTTITWTDEWHCSPRIHV